MKPSEPLHDDGEDLMAEIRATRQRISARFGDDTYRLVAHYQERQRRHGDRLIPAPETDRTDRSAA